MRCRSVVNDVPPRLKQTDLEIIFFFTNTWSHDVPDGDNFN